MVDAAPPAEATLPELADLLRRPRARRAQRVASTAACCARPSSRAGARLARPAGAVHGRAGAPPAPARPPAAARARWPSRSASRSRSPTARSPTPRRARASSARCSRGCARTRATIGEALALLRPRAAAAPARRARPTAAARTRGARRRLPALDGLPDEPGVYLVRNAEGQVLYVGKSVAVRTRARAHFQPSATEGSWVAQAETVDYETTRSELGALLLEGRLIRRHAAAGQRPPQARRRLRLPALPPGHRRSPSSRSRPRPRPGCGVSVGPLRGRAPAVELLEQLNSLFGLRHCGRALPRRDSPSAYGQMGRCLSPCLGDLDPNLYRRRLDQALALFTGEGDGGAALLAHVDDEMRRAADRRQFERAALAAPPPRAPGLAARRPRRARSPPPTRGRGSCWPSTRAAGASTPCGSSAGASSTGRRSTRPRTSTTSARRTAEALRHDGRPGGTASLTPDDVDEARLVATWLAPRRGGRRGRPSALRPAPPPARLGRLPAPPAGACGAADGRRPPRRRRRSPAAARSPREGQRDDLGGRAAVAGGERRARLGLAAHDAPGRSARARSETTLLVSRPTSRSPRRSGVPAGTGALRRRPRRWRFGLPR